jgi:hypothetical protein
MPIQETEKYQKTIEALKNNDDCCHSLFFLAGCGFGGGWHVNHESQFSERRLRQIAEERRRYFTIPELKEFFDIDEAAKLFFSLVPNDSKVLHEHHFIHWFGQSHERMDNWKKIKTIVNEAAQRLYGVPCGQQDRKAPNLANKP